MQANQFTIYGGAAVRRQPHPAWSGPQPGVQAAPAPPPPSQPPNMEITRKWQETMQEIQSSIKNTNDKTRQMYDDMNKKFLDYLRK